MMRIAFVGSNRYNAEAFQASREALYLLLKTPEVTELEQDLSGLVFIEPLDVVMLAQALCYLVQKEVAVTVIPTYQQAIQEYLMDVFFFEFIQHRIEDRDIFSC